MPSLITTSLLTSASRKCPATTDTSVEPLQKVFSNKSTKVLTSVKGMLSISAENIKAVNTEKSKLVHLLFKVAKGCLPVMNVGQLLDPKINLGDPPKDLVEE